jgi:hypothetical protein
MLKQDRNSERGRPSGIKEALCLRLDPDNVEVSEAASGSTETVERVRVGAGHWVRAAILD